MLIARPFISQAKWGHPSPYPDGHWTPYTPLQYLLHYGGGGPYRAFKRARAFLIVRGWRWYHINSKDMRDLAYNLIAWRKMIVGRGLNQNGAHRNSTKWGKITLAVAFLDGPHEPVDPRALHTFARQWLAYPLPVTDHGSLPDQSTLCAGGELKGLIRDEFWLHQFILRRTRTLKNLKTQWAVRALRYRLKTLGYDIRPGRHFNKRTRRAVLAFQTDRDLETDGIVGPETLRELGKGTP